MGSLKLSKNQSALARLPFEGQIFLEGPAGCGKTTAALERLKGLVLSGVPAETILILAPQRTLALPYREAFSKPDLPPGGQPAILTLGGLAQRMIALFWPVIARPAGFAHPHRPPGFLTLETAQYYLAGLVQPLLDQGNFDSIVIDRSRLLSQILDNLNKAAVVGFPITDIAARLKAAWIGEPAQLKVYDEAQDCGLRFRRYCLENNLLDFSLQIEVFLQHLWPSLLCQSHLTQSYRHLIYDNIEEDVPVAHDLVAQWLPKFETALLIYDSEGGFRKFLAAYPQSGYQLRELCQTQIQFTKTWVTPPALSAFQAVLSDCIARRKPSAPAVEFHSAIQITYHRFFPQLADWICGQVGQLIQKQHVPPAEIAILSPFLSDSLRFTIMNRLEHSGVAAQSHRPSRRLREEPATQCLLALAKLAHPAWELRLSHFEARSALMQAIEGLDLVRADLLSKIVYRQHRSEERLGSFDNLLPEMQERITYTAGERYESLRSWLIAYQNSEPAALDVFLSRLFGEVLSQPNFGFHNHYDAAAVSARLVESVRKFRRSTEARWQGDLISIGKEYIQMVEEGVVAAQYIEAWQEPPENAVLLAPAYTFLTANRPVQYQFWLDVGNLSWWERLYQPLTQPYVLSRHWPENAVWSDLEETRANQETLHRLTNGLIRRCTRQIQLCVIGVNERGDEQRGPLLQAVQTLYRRFPPVEERSDV